MTPIAVDEINQNDVDYVERICRICGFKIMPIISEQGVSWSHAKCKQCLKFAHFKCVDNLFIPSKAFRCSKVKRYLGQGGKELYSKPGVVPSSTKQPPPRRSALCIICGDDARSRTQLGTIFCKRACTFFVHTICLRIHHAILDEDFSPLLHQCSNVQYQIRGEEIEDNAGLNWEGLVKLSETLKLRGRVNTTKYNNKRKRWLNDEIECNLCGRYFGINEINHTAEFCAASTGTPITDRNRGYPFAKLKRFRCLTYMVP